MIIIKHSFCKLEKCPLIGKIAIVIETVKTYGPEFVSGGTLDLNYEPESYWATVEDRLHKFKKGDLK